MFACMVFTSLFSISVFRMFIFEGGFISKTQEEGTYRLLVFLPQLVSVIMRRPLAVRPLKD